METSDVDKLLQIVALMIDRFGGEVIFSRAEFEQFEGVPVLMRNLTPDYVRLRLAVEDEESPLASDLTPESPESPE